MKISSNAIVTIVITLIIAGVGYWYFFVGGGNQATLIMGLPANPAQTQFQVLVSELKPITFDSAIFSDPRFLVLSDLSTPIASEIAGRSDPFASFFSIKGK